MHTTRPGRFWIALGGPRAVRIVYVIMLFYAFVIGGLMLGYADVQNCLADYSDQNASALKVRTEASTDDRLLSQRVEAVAKSDRVRIIANQQALNDLIKAFIAGKEATIQQAAVRSQAVNQLSLDQFAANEKERSLIETERAAIEKRRTDAPIPGPPSEQC